MLAEVIPLGILQQRCSDAQTPHYSYVVETPDRSSVTVHISYHEHNYLGFLKTRATTISFTFPSFTQEGQPQVVMEVLRVSPPDRFWSPDLLSPLLGEK